MLLELMNTARVQYITVELLTEYPNYYTEYPNYKLLLVCDFRG